MTERSFPTLFFPTLVLEYDIPPFYRFVKYNKKAFYHFIILHSVISKLPFLGKKWVVTLARVLALLHTLRGFKLPGRITIWHPSTDLRLVFENGYHLSFRDYIKMS